MADQSKGMFALDAIDTGMKVIGGVLQGFGAYGAHKDQQRELRAQRRRQAELDRIAEIERRRAEEQQRVQNMLGYGGYARAMQDDRNAPYKGFAARVGL